MSTEQQVLRISGEAAEDLSLYQYHFVVKDSTSGKIRLMDTAIEIPDGILQNAPTAGQGAVIMKLGISKLVANDALAIGTFIKPEFVSVTDCGKGQDCEADRGKIRCRVQEASSAEDDLLSVELLEQKSGGIGIPIKKTLVTTDTTAGLIAYTAAQIIGGFIIRTPGSAVTDTVPTATNIIDALPSPYDGDSFEFTIRNTSAYTLTIGTATGVTLSGTMTIATVQAKKFLCVINSATTCTIYSMGTTIY